MTATTLVFLAIAAATTTDPAPAADKLAWLRAQVAGNLDALLDDLQGSGAIDGRDLPNGALAALVLAYPPSPNVTATATGGRAAPHPASAACRTAALLLRRAGSAEDMSFGGQSTPALLHTYSGCFNASEATWLAAMVNRSLPQSQAAATPQEVSYTNMWLMSTVDAITWGELELLLNPNGTAGADPEAARRGAVAADVGYAMLDEWLAYTRASGVHEFTSPTYTYVQLSALYTAYIHARRQGYREAIGAALDLIWADTCAVRLSNLPPSLPPIARTHALS